MIQIFNAHFQGNTNKGKNKKYTVMKRKTFVTKTDIKFKYCLKQIFSFFVSASSDITRIWKHINSRSDYLYFHVTFVM